MSETPAMMYEKNFRTKLRERGGEGLCKRLEQTACGREFIMMLLQVHCGSQLESAHKSSAYLGSRLLDLRRNSSEALGRFDQVLARDL